MSSTTSRTTRAAMSSATSRAVTTSSSSGTARGLPSKVTVGTAANADMPTARETFLYGPGAVSQEERVEGRRGPGCRSSSRGRRRSRSSPRAAQGRHACAPPTPSTIRPRPSRTPQPGHGDGGRRQEARSSPTRARVRCASGWTGAGRRATGTTCWAGRPAASTRPGWGR